MFLILQKNTSNKKPLCWRFPFPLGPGAMVTLLSGRGCSPKKGQHEWRGHMNYVLTLTDSLILTDPYLIILGLSQGFPFSFWYNMEHEPFIGRVASAATPLLKGFHVWLRKLISDNTVYVKQSHFTWSLFPQTCSHSFHRLFNGIRIQNHKSIRVKYLGLHMLPSFTLIKVLTFLSFTFNLLNVMNESKHFLHIKMLPQQDTRTKNSFKWV